jgi:hypothetical protein
MYIVYFDFNYLLLTSANKLDNFSYSKKTCIWLTNIKCAYVYIYTCYNYENYYKCTNE